MCYIYSVFQNVTNLLQATVTGADCIHEWETGQVHIFHRLKLYRSDRKKV